MDKSQLQVIEEFLEVISMEITAVVPKIITAILIIVVAYVSLRLLGYLMKKILGFADIDKFIKRYWGGELPLSFNRLVIVLVYIAVILAAVYGVISIFVTREYLEAASSMILYGTRMISIIVVSLILFTVFTLVIDRIMGESRLKGYLLFIITLLLTSMMIDVTTLSESVKESLYTGLSIGIGASLAVFAVWFFFHEYLEKRLTSEKKKK
ncbi:MAG: hypothetical protein NZ929_00150 [Aigarchaeota archaeon]|nr:hypothetical protein [Aigarchaeota archaeon]MCX8193124.1 hypothetical protein [Nitrososphaeria archaeon]MDW7986747.1 hypothetical protein [Nitrososphaerota archaeon]